MIAAIYARKSTDETGVGEEAKSVSRQIERGKAYAADKGWLVAEEFIFSDDGISGAEFARRPGFIRMMNALTPKPPFQVLIMSEESRLGRESIETAYALKQLITAGVRVFFYLDDRERTLDTALDKLMLSLTNFAAEVEREKARQRTYDAMVGKARSGHVTGGRVFGYDNVEVFVEGPDAESRKRIHVKRVANEPEAAVVRRIFEQSARGWGFRRIAHDLNEARVPCPRPRPRTPRGWSPSTVRDVLYRDTYRGVVVWGRSQKRDTWGQKRPQRRSADEWLRLDAPELRIVSDELWEAAHDRLRTSHEGYLRGTGDKPWGRPGNGIDSKYLLTGLAVCGSCGGSLTARSRSHGKRRAFFYHCLCNVQRGRAACSNDLAAPMEEVDQAVLTAVQADLLRPEVITAVLKEALARLRPASDPTRQRRAVESSLTRVKDELTRLAAAVAAGGNLPALLEAMKERERQRARIEQELTALDQLAQVGRLDLTRLERTLRAKLGDWRGLLWRHVAEARQVLRKLLAGRLVFTPRQHEDGRYYEFTGEGVVEPLLAGAVLPKAGVAPTGFEPVFLD
ncbi:MAG: recombinase family protein [Candidatus Methylomirabilales bacterium]